MGAAPQALPTTNKAWMVRTGWVLSTLPVLAVAMGATMIFVSPTQVAEGMGKFGWPARTLALLATLEIGCVVIYLIPRSAVLGAILLTGYFGGAVATHVRVGDPGWPLALVCGILSWAGLYLRDARLRALLPFRRRP